MRKKIALFLVCIMFINSFPVHNLFALPQSRAGEDMNFTVRTNKIKLSNKEGENTEPTPPKQGGVLGEDEGAVEWDLVKNPGREYILEYYINSGDGIKKIRYTILMDKKQVGYKPNEPNPKEEGTEPLAAGEEGLAVVTVKVFAGNNSNLETLNYKETVGDIPGNTISSESYTKTLDLKRGNNHSELQLNIDNRVTTAFQIKKDAQGKYKAQFMTTDLSNKDMDGNIVEFKLERKLSGESESGPVTREVIKSLKGFKVEPQHLYVTPGGIQSRDTIDFKEIKNQGEPGSLPGLKVTFELPKQFGLSPDGSTFLLEKIDENIIIPIKLDDIDKKNEVNYTLDIKNKKVLSSNGKEEKGKLEIKDTLDGGKEITLYFVNATDKKEGEYKEYPDKVLDTVWDELLIDWDMLNSNTRITVDLRIPRGNQTLEPKTGQGHTYMKFTTERQQEGTLLFKIDRYKYGPAFYQLSVFGRDGHLEDKPPGSLFNEGDDPFLPCDVSPNVGAGGKYYRVDIEPTIEKDGLMTSQKLLYDPKDEEVKFTVPEIKMVDNVYVVPSKMLDFEGDQPLAIGFDIEWSTFDKRLIEKLHAGEGKLYYELNLAKSGEDTIEDKETGKMTENTGQTIKVFEVLEKDGNIILQDYDTKKEETTKQSNDKLKKTKVELMTYNKPEDAENLQKNMNKKFDFLQKFDSDGKKIDFDGNERYGKVEIKTDEELPEDDKPEEKPYYLKIRYVYEPNEGPVQKSGFSNFYSIAINNVDEQIPVPKNVEVTSKEESATLIFDSINLNRYKDFMITPLKLELNPDDKRTYEIYLYQDKKINGLNEEVTSEDIDNWVKNEKDNIMEIEASEGDKSEVVLTNREKDHLRNKDKKTVLKFSYDSINNDGNQIINFKGLDTNQVYYIQIRVMVQPEMEIGGTIKTFKEKYSLFSKICTFTTGAKPLPPTPDEQIPPAPSKFFIVDQPNNTTVNLGWEPPEFAVGEEQDIYYEFIRSEDMQLKSEELKRENKVEALVDANKTYMGYDTKEPYIRYYKNGTWGKLEPEQASASLRLMDNTLRTNAIYYYYIRTVKLVGGQPVASEWIMLPVTTSPIEKPINLQIEPAKEQGYDSKRETVISFWAPIPKGAKIPDEYDFQIAVRGEKDEDFRLDYKVTLIKEENIDEKYQKYFYKIQGLKPSTRYQIKVRIQDKTKPKEEGGDYPTSLYSDQVITRTDYDEEEQEKDDKFEEYLKKYDTEAEKLRRKPYWKVSSSSRNATYKYRESYMKTELAISNEYDLMVEEGSDSVYYYFPAALLEIASRENTILTVNLQGISVSLRPYTLTQENEEIKEALQRIEDKRLEDYYIIFDISLGDRTSTINGQATLTPEIYIGLELAYLNQEDIYTEDSIMDELNKLIDQGREEVIDDLEKAVVQGKIEDERLDAIIQKALDRVVDKHEDRVERIVDKVISKKIGIDTIEKPILLRAALDAYAVMAYYKEIEWKSLYAFATAGGFAVEALKLGTYVFTGKDDLAMIMPDIPGAQDSLAKYQLTDFFEIDNPTKMGWYSTKDQVYGVAARLLGAKPYEDSIEYLKQKNVQGINRIGTAKAIRQDETLYIVMQVYEKINNVSVNTVYIKNKQSVQNIGAFQTYYRPYVYAAVELGVVETRDGKVMPEEGITCKQVLGMFTKILPK